MQHATGRGGKQGAHRQGFHKDFPKDFSLFFLSNREGAKNSGGKIAGLVPATGNTGKLWSLPPLAPQCLTTQVHDQRIFTGRTPEWLDTEGPAV